MFKVLTALLCKPYPRHVVSAISIPETIGETETELNLLRLTDAFMTFILFPQTHRVFTNLCLKGLRTIYYCKCNRKRSNYIISNQMYTRLYTVIDLTGGFLMTIFQSKIFQVPANKWFPFFAVKSNSLKTFMRWVIIDTFIIFILHL